MDTVFHNRDPRFTATFFYPESPWQGGVVYFHKNTTGTIVGDWPAKAPARNWKKTGFLIRKRVNESIELPIGGEDETDFMVFRYGEILLNLAEAAFYLGKTDEALDALNQVRERAGMPEKDEITEDIIRNERAVELAFEEHRYWDLRRWRNAVEVLDATRFKGLDYVYDFNNQAYKFTLKNAEGGARVFQERHYYLPIGVNRTSDNPNLVENPGYSGS